MSHNLLFCSMDFKHFGWRQIMHLHECRRKPFWYAVENINENLYSVVLNKHAARLFIFDNFSYLHALIRYLHVNQFS